MKAFAYQAMESCESFPKQVELPSEAEMQLWETNLACMSSVEAFQRGSLVTNQPDLQRQNCKDIPSTATGRA